MLRRKRLAIGDEGKEAPDCRQTAVPCPDRGHALLFNMLQERQHFSAYEILQAENAYGFVLPCGNEAQKKTPRVPICQDRPVGGVSLFDEPLVKKRVQQFRQGG